MAGYLPHAGIDTDMVIGLYQENPKASLEEMKNLVGELMMQFDEPTAMAHEKLIYWAFGKEGRILKIFSTKPGRVVVKKCSQQLSFPGTCLFSLLLEQRVRTKIRTGNIAL